MIKVAIVDDHAIVRSGLRQFFSEQVDLRVVGEAASGAGALDLVREVDVDVLVLDLSMPGLSGADVLTALRDKVPVMGILILSGHPEKHYAVNLIKQGANGYLNKGCDPMDIVNAIRIISLGKRYVTPVVADLLAEHSKKKEVPPHLQLSERELEVFLRLARGQMTGEAAKALSLSIKSISTYRKRVLEKMKFVSNSDLTYYAIKNNLIP